MFVFNAKSDRDGSEQPTMCITSRQGERLAYFDEEEVDELIRIRPLLTEYLSLWEKKALSNKIQADEQTRREISAGETIGVEL